MAGGSALSSVMSSSFTYQSQCNTGTCSNGTPSLSGVSIISAAQSYPVPYEYPYKSALKAFWAALVAHYNIVNFPTYYSQLNYLRFGGSVGSEWYPYCTASLGALTAPYQYRQSGTNATFTGWVDYYAEMVLYTQSLGSTLQVMWSINSAEVPPVYDYADTEATTAMAYANAFGAKNGFGSQGLSVQDVLNCTFGTNNCDPPPSPPLNPSASNWHPNFKNVRANASILELQQSAISYPKDTNCTNGCGTGNGSYSGDLANWMQFAWQSGATDFEVYWRDLELAYGDGAYCTVNAFNNGCSLLISLGGQLVDQAQVAQFFRAVGRGQTSPGTWCPTSSQTAAKATGDCSYATALHSAHGPHP